MEEDKVVQANDGNQLILIDRILRNKIFNFRYWKEECFGLTAVTLIDKAISLDSIGGTYGGTRKPTQFICLIAKLLQIKPEKDIIYEFVRNRDYKYVNALALFYLRLIGKPKEIYQILEVYYSDYRRIRIRNTDGNYGIIHMDEFVEQLLNEEIQFDIVLPRLPKRWVLEENGQLEQRVSALQNELEPEDQPPIPFTEEQPPIPNFEPPQKIVRNRSRSQEKKKHKHHKKEKHNKK